MENIGFFSDNFDPPHAGHIAAAEHAIKERKLEKLLIIPALATPKELSMPDGATLEQRLAMLRLCFADVPGVEIHSPEEYPEHYCPDSQRVDGTEVMPGKSDIRRLLTFRCADDFLPPALNAYIQQNNLYGTGRNLRHLPMERLEQAVVALLKPNRVAHVLGCRDTAVLLAQKWGADETDAARAGLLHDITKALPAPLQMVLCHSYGVSLSSFASQNPKTLHALTGSLVAQSIFGENEAVVNAIASHTTGKPYMNTLEKIIYVADYMEPNRNFEGVEQLRSLAFTDLDGALKLGLEMTLTMLRQQGREISPETKQTLAWLKGKEEKIC